MQAQQIEKGTLLGELKVKATSQTIKEVTPLGVKSEVNEVGQFAGIYNANHSGTSSMYLKTDGTYDWETKSMEMTNEGDIVVSTSHGTGKITGPKLGTGEGEGILMTQSPKLSKLNNRKIRVELTTDPSTGEARGAKIFAL